MSKTAEHSSSGLVSATDVETFQAHGTVVLRHVLDAEALDIVRAAYAWKLAHPGPYAQEMYPGSSSTFIQASGDSSAEPSFQAIFAGTPLPRIAAALSQRDRIWFLNEQLFYKEAGGASEAARRTPWHQDSSYLAAAGDSFSIFWIPLDPAPQSCALEVVRGSHRGVTYNGSAVDADDDTKPLYVDGDLPRLPDIEAERSRWDIVGEAMVPGDVLVFQAATLHGGGATLPGQRRRSLTLRFIGPDVVRVERPSYREDTHVVNGDKIRRDHEGKIDGPFDRIEQLAIGEPAYAAGLLQVYP